MTIAPIQTTTRHAENDGKGYKIFSLMGPHPDDPTRRVRVTMAMSLDTLGKHPPEWEETLWAELARHLSAPAKGAPDEL
jgi:hypothetical protein